MLRENIVQQQNIIKSMSKHEKHEKLPEKNEKAKLITETIVEMIALDHQPNSIVDLRLLWLLQKKYISYQTLRYLKH